MISGYFLYSPEVSIVRERLKKRIRSIAALLATAFLLYGIWSFIENCLIGQIDLLIWVQNSFPLEQLPHKLVFGTFFCGPMWYLYAAFWDMCCFIIFSLVCDWTHYSGSPFRFWQFMS